jgi:hypothetical protein
MACAGVGRLGRSRKWADLRLNDHKAGGTRVPPDIHCEGGLLSQPRFKLGQVVATPGALEALEDAGQLLGEFLRKHVSGDWGDVEPDDRHENETSIEGGFRILSAYKTSKGVRLWVITEADRSSTCILLPEEY